MSKIKVVEDGRLTVPLFHGTSSLFLESIRQHGLGGRSIVEDLGIRKAARLFLELAEPYKEREEFLLEYYFCGKVAADSAEDVLREGFAFNFRYGGTYLSYVAKTAGQYALLNPTGSECLDSILKARSLLASVHEELADRPEFNSLRDFAAGQHRPILIRADNIEVRLLRSEQGGTIESHLKLFEDDLNSADPFPDRFQQHNFELTGALSGDQLTLLTPSEVTDIDENGGSRKRIVLLPFNN